MVALAAITGKRRPPSACPTDSRGRLKTSEQKGGIAPEYGFQNVRFIDNQQAQAGKRPLGITAGQFPHEPGVTQVRGRDDDPGSFEGRLPVGHRHVTRNTRNPVCRYPSHSENASPTDILVHCRRLLGIEH